MTEHNQGPAYQPPTAPVPGGVYGHSQPAPYGQPWPAMPEPRNAFGLTALILGAVGLLFGIVPFTGFIAFGLGLVGIIFALANIGRLRRRRATNRVTTWFGGAASLGAVVLGIVGMVIVFSALNQFGNDMDEISNDMDRYNACVERADTLEEMADCE